MQAVLGLVEPQSSGLGGGGFMVVHDRQSGRTVSLDGRETAPASATADYFKVNGQELGFGQAVLSGRSVGVPGAIALYKADDSPQRHGNRLRAKWLAEAHQETAENDESSATP